MQMVLLSTQKQHNKKVPLRPVANAAAKSMHPAQKVPRAAAVWKAVGGCGAMVSVLIRMAHDDVRTLPRPSLAR